MKRSLTLTDDDLTKLDLSRDVKTPCRGPRLTSRNTRGWRLRRYRIPGGLLTDASCPGVWTMEIKHRERKPGGGAAVTKESVALGRKKESTSARDRKVSVAQRVIDLYYAPR